MYPPYSSNISFFFEFLSLRISSRSTILLTSAKWLLTSNPQTRSQASIPPRYGCLRFIPAVFYSQDRRCVVKWVCTATRMHNDENAQNARRKTIMQLIISTSDQIQTRMVENLLKEAGIPCFSKYQGYGGYLKVYMGTSVYGIDTYVNDEDYGRAKEIVDVFFAAPPDESQNLDGQPYGDTEPGTDEQPDGNIQLDEAGQLGENSTGTGSESDAGDTEDTPINIYLRRKTAIRIFVAIMLIALAIGFVIGLLR